jgi:N-methylhydantoinase A/oxoprolinase/acetone carboxylase beta subunit
LRAASRYNAPVATRTGVDTGGTFTDFVRLSPQGLSVQKLKSTPADPAAAILQGITELSPGPRADIVHGSTVATNAVLERRGARVALLATRGFEDVPRIGRQTRPALYDFFVRARPPLVDPSLTFGLSERMSAAGDVIDALDLGGVRDAAAAARTGGADIVAVCLLHSYANPAHEATALAALRADGWLACGSHEVLPEYREYERWSTTLLNAYVTPIMSRYLERLERALSGSRLAIMQSNGGTISASAARAQAVRTVLSGPAAGVVGARSTAAAAGFDRIIAFDMGGTSTDVSLVDGDIGTTADSVIGGFPVRLPVLDIHTVGAGGGSIASVDTGGALRVGPESAGADPGPACYGRGTSLTVTDANLILGRLDPELFFGGRMRLDVDRARDAASGLARDLGIGIADVSEGVVRVANANMERAIRVVSIERGHDPRPFTLVAFGGAGGMHACELARRLEMRTVLVPRHAGVLSALGMLMADVTRDFSASVLLDTASIAPRALEARFAPLEAEAVRALEAEGFPRGRRAIARLVDVRYIGQSYEITLPYSSSFRSEFDRLHGRLYGYSNPERPTELVNVRVRATGITSKPTLPFSRPKRAHAARAYATRRGRFEGRETPVRFHRWDDLVPGATGRGAAVIGGGEATVVIPPDFIFRVDGYGNVVATRRGRG